LTTTPDALDRGRDADPVREGADRGRAAALGSGLLQIRQFWRKRPCRQNSGIAP
jgi:hypothetical protein